jgi:diadenosine tetraphosphate (Ap4A) HIT family hydrolase
MADNIDPKVQEVFDESIFPFTTDLTVKPLDPRVIPEPPRVGEGGVDCPSCTQPDTKYIWVDDDWRLRPFTPTPLRGLVLLETRAHVDSFADMPSPLLGDLGPLVARIERAILGIGDVGRVHVDRIGDGGAHFHLWFLPRPLGALQLRGSPLTLWLDVLPELPGDVVDAALDSIATALVAGGGRRP